MVYPVTAEPDYYKEHKDSLTILARLTNNNSYSRYSDYAVGDDFAAHLILIAPPNSLSLTPSREELSLQGGTIPTIKALLKAFVEKYGTISTTARRNELINRGIKEQEFTSFSTVQYKLKTWNESPEYILSRKDFIERLVYCNSRIEQSERDRFYKKVIQKNKGQNPLVYAFIKATNKRNNKEDATLWFRKNVTLPMERVVKRAGLDTGNLYLLINSYAVCSKTNRNDLIELRKADPLNFDRLKPVLNNMVILTHRQTKVESEANSMLAKTDNAYFGSQGAVVYVVPRKKDILDKARAAFSNLGKLFVDLTVEQEAAPKTVKKVTGTGPVPKVVKPPKLAGFGCFSQLNQDWERSPVRVTHPRTVLVWQKRKDLSGWIIGLLGTRHINFENVKYLFKGKVGIVTTEKQREKAANTFPDLVPLRRLMLEELINQYPGEKRMKELNFIFGQSSTYNLLKTSKKIAEAMELPAKATKEEHVYYHLFCNITSVFFPQGHVERTLYDYIKKLAVVSEEAAFITEELNKVPLLKEMLEHFRFREKPLTPSQDEALYLMFNLIYKEFRNE